MGSCLRNAESSVAYSWLQFVIITYQPVHSSAFHPGLDSCQLSKDQLLNSQSNGIRSSPMVRVDLEGIEATDCHNLHVRYDRPLLPTTGCKLHAYLYTCSPPANDPFDLGPFHIELSARVPRMFDQIQNTRRS
jgi:hypothetical protein